MPTRDEVDLLREANAEISRMVRSDLAMLARQLTGSPESIRNTLLAVVPDMVEQYGDIAATASAEWFERVYGNAAVMARPMDRVYVEKGVKSASGHLWRADTASTLAALDVKLDKWVKQTGRESVRMSADRHGYMWARVPSGRETCTWCLILASRGGVYSSQQSASQRGDGDRYHGACDCQAVAIRDQEDYPAGYDPDELYDVYSASRDAAGSDDIKDIAAAMRREFPDRVTDAVHAH